MLGIFILFRNFNFRSRTFTPPTQDTLLAQECGMDGLKCCASEPKCSFGQECCVNPQDSKENYCADKCGLGGDGQFCRANSECDAGYTCMNRKCAKCGGDKQVCCGVSGSNDRCLVDKKKALVCYSEKCVECGVIGNPCCGQSCDKVDRSKQLAECKNDLCQACGGNGQAACLAGAQCADGYLFSNTFCYSCGENRQPCCADKKCHGSKLICQNNICGPGGNK